MTNRFDQEAAHWDEEPRRIRLAEAIGSAVVRHVSLNDNQVLLDFGTGTGLVALKLRSCVRKIIAVDNSSGMLAVLKQKLDRHGIVSIEPREWTVGRNTRDLPAVDVIVSCMTLHHIKDTAAVARAFWDLLVPGGRIAIADLDEENGEFHGDPNITEHNGFNRKALQEIFERAGFNSVQFHEAHTVVKPLPDGRERPFTIFLMTGLKT
jgi:ubiquinone/menaquinone biosynthesis C-methylase UbiE